MPPPVPFPVTPIPPGRWQWNKRALLLTFLVALPLCLAGSVAYRLMAGASRQIEQKQQAILYHPNHQAILNACAQIHANARSFRRNPDWHNMAPNDFSKPDPSDPGIPSIIKTLKPAYIDIDTNFVRLEMGGGFYHYGIEAFFNGAAGQGTKRLVPGLWYYAEDGKIPAKTTK